MLKDCVVNDDMEYFVIKYNTINMIKIFYFKNLYYTRKVKIGYLLKIL